MKEKKMKKLLSYVLLCALVIANLVSNGMVSKASGSQTVNMKATMDTVEVKAGGTQHVSIPFKFASNYSISLTSIENVDISVNADETPISVTSNVVVLEKNSRKEVSTIVGGIDYV
ncbi:hypothetical protein, partial [Anaerosporobacter sp.]|uniref:hypothetical protein n=1 Tax=Anaerosporobacter sp. TaxID=1872529 RepID=UPI00286F563C